jgi:hypothetical protein
METKTNEPISRSQRVKLSPAVAKVLRINQAKIQQLTSTMQTLAMADQELVGALAADAGQKLEDFQRWEYEDGKDGATFLVLVPAPMAPPEPPQKPTPAQGE